MSAFPPPRARVAALCVSHISQSEGRGADSCTENTVRDVRGFAVRFRLDEGNWNIVDKDIPVVAPLAREYPHLHPPVLRSLVSHCSLDCA
jgi:hypothetical protein